MADVIRKKVIWGTGNIALLFIEEYKDWNPEFFIDNSIEKCGEIFLGKRIYHPSEIKNWDELYILVATDYYIEISNQLGEMGVLEKTKIIFYKEEKKQEVTFCELLDEIESFLINIEKTKKNKRQNVLLFGDFVAYDKGICSFVNKLSEEMQDKRFILISEADMISEHYLHKKIVFEAFNIPKLLKKNYIFKEDIMYSLQPEIINHVKTHDYLSLSAKNLRKRHEDMGRGYEYAISYYANYCIREIFRIIKPSVVVLWNQFHAIHTIVDYICKECNIEIRYMEFGVLPGTFVIEKNGQMGRSYPSVKSNEFIKLEISEKDKVYAKQIWDYLNKTGLNRNKQYDNNNLMKIRELLIPNRPIIFFAGQDDYESGLQPYNHSSQQFHSPIFHSTIHAVFFLANLAKKNSWNIIFKPHPIMVKYMTKLPKYPDNLIVINDENINNLIDFSDICITILSQVAYIAAIRRKATLMLGYTQLKNKGVTYESFVKDDIEEQIVQALKKGFTKEQEIAFQKHIAQLIKYYLYDDLQDRELRYGRDILKSFE
jgi:hypothetical protein